MSEETTELQLPKMTCKVISQKGTCAYGHKEGQTFDMEGGTPVGMCPAAFHAIYPSAYGLMFGAVFPWEQDKDAAQVACPDGTNPVIFEVRRLPG